MRRVLFAGGVVVVVGAAAFFGLRLRSDGGDVQGRFEAAVAKAQEAEEARDLKLVYEVKDDSNGGSMTVARKGDFFLFSMSDDDFGTFAFGEDADGQYTCFDFGAAEDSGFSIFGEPGCFGDEDAPDEDDEEGLDDILDIYGGGFTPSKFLELMEDSDITVTDAGTKKVAGFEGECFDIESEDEGDGKVCFAPKEGILLYMEWDGDDAPGEMRLKSYSTKVSDADVARPKFESNAKPEVERLPLTRWLGAKDAKCPLPENYFAAAMTVASDGAIWIADFHELSVFDPKTCEFRHVRTRYEEDFTPVSGLAAGRNGAVLAAYSEGQVVEIKPDGTTRELMPRDETTGGFSSSTTSPALFPDGSVAIARVEGVPGTKDQKVVLYRLVEGKPPQQLKEWKASWLGGDLLSVPGVGVAFVNPESGDEFHFTTDGKMTATKFSAVLPGLSNCGVYASATLRWEQFDEKTLRQGADGKTTKFQVPMPKEAGCGSAGLSPDGNSLWFVVAYPESEIGLYEVDLRPAK